MNVYIYCPPIGGKPLGTSIQSDKDYRRLYHLEDTLDIDLLIAEEWSAEAGSMAISRKLGTTSYFIHG